MCLGFFRFCKFADGVDHFERVVDGCSQCVGAQAVNYVVCYFSVVGRLIDTSVGCCAGASRPAHKHAFDLAGGYAGALLKAIYNSCCHEGSLLKILDYAVSDAVHTVFLFHGDDVELAGAACFPTAAIIFELLISTAAIYLSLMVVLF